MKNSDNGYIYYDYCVKTEKEIIAATAWTSVFHWIYAIVSVLTVVFIIFTFFFQVVVVSGDSMLPTLQDGDFMLVSIYPRSEKCGDIVFISSKTAETGGIVKRIIAKENQTVSVDYQSGTVTVDGIALDEPYIYEKMKNLWLLSHEEVNYPFTVPEGCVFVMGDNRNFSHDSRSCDMGAIDENYIVGKVIFPAAADSDN